MSSVTMPQAASSRFPLSHRAMTVFGIVGAITFAASSSAPTPLYRVYQDHLALSPFLLTMIFAAYVVSLLAALLTVGSLSDHLGRRPVIFAALAVNALAMLLFIEAHSAPALILARAVQGFAAGAATTTLGAAILDTNRTHGPVYNSVTAFVGLTLGSLGSGALVSYAPAPEQLVYAMLLVTSLALATILLVMPETTARKSGALAALRPQVRVPPQAQAALYRLTPVNIATWSLGGFYFSLMPSLVRVATGLTAPVIGGLVVAALTFSATIAVLALRKQPAERVLAIGAWLLVFGVALTLAGVDARQAVLMLLGTMVAGFGFGAAFSGTVRIILPLGAAHERAGLLSAFYVQSYLAFSLPAVLAGLAAPVFGLAPATYVYGGVVIVLALASLVAIYVARRRAGADM